MQDLKKMKVDRARRRRDLTTHTPEGDSGTGQSDTGDSEAIQRVTVQ